MRRRAGRRRSGWCRCRCEVAPAHVHAAVVGAALMSMSTWGEGAARPPGWATIGHAKGTGGAAGGVERGDRLRARSSRRRWCSSRAGAACAADRVGRREVPPDHVHLAVRAHRDVGVDVAAGRLASPSTGRGPVVGVVAAGGVERAAARSRVARGDDDVDAAARRLVPDHVQPAEGGRRRASCRSVIIGLSCVPVGRLATGRPTVLTKRGPAGGDAVHDDAAGRAFSEQTAVPDVAGGVGGEHRVAAEVEAGVGGVAPGTSAVVGTARSVNEVPPFVEIQAL